MIKYVLIVIALSLFSFPVTAHEDADIEYDYLTTRFEEQKFGYSAYFILSSGLRDVAPYVGLDYNFNRNAKTETNFAHLGIYSQQMIQSLKKIQSIIAIMTHFNNQVFIIGYGPFGVEREAEILKILHEYQAKFTKPSS